MVALSAAAGLQPDEDAVELGFRFSALQVGYWLGWASILAVIAGLALDIGARHRWVLIAATLAAAAGNSVAMIIPWRDWLDSRRGRLLLDLWCGGLIAFVAALVVGGGSTFSLLLFLVVPFIAVVQVGRRRGFWLMASGATCAAVAAVLPLSAGATVMRLALVAAAVAVALLASRAIRRESAAVRVERTRVVEASHRIKNDLQTAADLLLLARPAGEDGAAFDETAARIRSIAAVHRLLTDAGRALDAAALLHAIAGRAPAPVTVEADTLPLDAATAQKLGIVANELVTNACRHGGTPIVVRFDVGAAARLSVDDGGAGTGAGAGLGLDLVRRIVEQGLGGSFELRRVDGATRAVVEFPA
jgi:two-component sensor histidine kinase